jgi:hypothetical protein
MSDLTIHFEEPDFTLATFRNVLIWSFRGPVSLKRIQRGHMVHRDLARRHPDGFAVMSIIGDTVPLTMEADARELSGKIISEFNTQYCAVGDVIEGTGLKAATARSVLSGIRMFGRMQCPAKVFSDASAASVWLAPYLKQPGPPDATGRDLAEAALRVRSATSATNRAPVASMS